MIFTIWTEFHNFNWSSQFGLKFTISTEFHNFNRISQFQMNFSISTEFHNYDWISRHQLNFAISTEFNSDNSFNRDISPSLMILFVDWYFLNRIVSICASFHSIYIQWTQPDISITSSYFVICWLALSHLNKALLWLCPLVRFMIYNALCTFRWGSVEDDPLHSSVSGMKNI